MMVHGQTMRADLSTRGGNLFMRKILRGVTGTESLPLTSVYASSSPMLLMEQSARCQAKRRHTLLTEHCEAPKPNALMLLGTTNPHL